MYNSIHVQIWKKALHMCCSEHFPSISSYYDGIVVFYLSDFNANYCLSTQEERLRWSSTPSSQIWTGTACWGRKQSLFLSWSPRTTPVTLTVSVRVQCRCLWSQSTFWTPSASFSPLWSVPPCGLWGGGRHQWWRARGAPTVLFLLASLQQGTDKTPRTWSTYMEM